MANTTSGSYTFEKNFAIDDIIAEAYERIGLVGTAGHQIHSARRSLNILFQEWGNRGIHFWEVGDTNIDLIEGQAEYTFYRSSGDGTSSVTVGGTSGASTYGLSDILSAQYRTDRTSTDQTDLPMTKVSRSTYAALFAIVSTTYGSGNGSTTFNVPDLRDRLPLGKGTNNSSLGAITAAAGASAVVATASGSASLTKSTGTFATSAKDSSTSSALTNVTSGGHTHNLTLPAQVFNYIIKT